MDARSLHTYMATRIFDGSYGAFGQLASASEAYPYCYGTSQYVTITPGQECG